LDFEEITVTKAPAEEFKDEFTPAKGIVVFDMAHSNNVDVSELRILVLRLTARGYKVEYLMSKNALEETLKYADAFVVISPRSSYSSKHVDLLSRFVEKRGKLLLVHDPTRKDSINSLSAGFGIIFDSGYLYNQVENDGNYQYIFLKEFEKNELTRGLSKVTMYAASSITSSGKGLAFTDENTFSSTQPKQRFTPMVLTSSGNVLALGDLSFMLEPYNSVFDNNKLASNIADFLTTGGRVYHITDYPYYLGDEYFLVYTNESILEESLEIMRKIDRRANLRSKDPGFGHTLVVGLYSNSLVRKYMDDAGIILNDKLEIKGVGKLRKDGTFIISLTQRGGRRVILVAADDKPGLLEAASSLDKLGEISLTDFVAYSAYEPEEKEPSSTPPVVEEQESLTEEEQVKEPTSYSSKRQVLSPNLGR
jgi:hypothetical protein